MSEEIYYVVVVNRDESIDFEATLEAKNSVLGYCKTTIEELKTGIKGGV